MTEFHYSLMPKRFDKNSSLCSKGYWSHWIALKFSKLGQQFQNKYQQSIHDAGTWNKLVMILFGGDRSLRKNYVGRNIVFELKFKDWLVIVSKHVFIFRSISSLWDRDFRLQLRKNSKFLNIGCNVELWRMEKRELNELLSN